MDTFSELIERLKFILVNNNRINYEKLNPPLPKGEVDFRLEKLGIKDEKFKQLYYWQNGVGGEWGPGIRDQIFHEGSLIALEYHSRPASKNVPYNSSLILTLSDGDAEGILFNNAPGSEYGQLYLYSVPGFFIEEPISYFDSLTTMLTTTIEAYQHNIFTYNEKDNWLEVDYSRYIPLASKLNPLSSYWLNPT